MHNRYLSSSLSLLCSSFNPSHLSSLPLSALTLSSLTLSSPLFPSLLFPSLLFPYLLLPSPLCLFPSTQYLAHSLKCALLTKCGWKVVDVAVEEWNRNPDVDAFVASVKSA